MKTVLITGGAGFIGSHLVERLLRDGFSARVLDDLSTGSLSNLPQNAAGFTFITGDVLDPATVKKAVEGVDAVFHLAALSSVPNSINAPLETSRVNFSGTVSLLDAARKLAVKKFIFASSAAVYGDMETQPVKEDSPANPMTPYAIDKMACERYLSFFSRQFGMEAFTLRFFNVYGPRQNPRSPYSGVIHRFMEAALNGRPVEIFGDGLQTRDFVFVDDVVDVLVKSLSLASAPEGPVNVGSGKPVSLLDLAAVLENIVGAAIGKQFMEKRAGDIRHSLADIKKLRAVYRMAPSTSLEDGLRKTINHIRKTGSR